MRLLTLHDKQLSRFRQVVNSDLDLLIVPVCFQIIAQANHGIAYALADVLSLLKWGTDLTKQFLANSR